MQLKGKTAIVVGGASGSGRAAAQVFASAGAKVVIADINETMGASSIAEVTKGGNEGLFVVCDIRCSDQCANVIQTAKREYGGIDVLFNSAGLACAARTVINASEEEWDRTIDINVKGTFLMCKHAVPAMIESGGGSIVNTASVWGLVAGMDVAPYCAAKGAVVLLTKAMALDHAKDNIRVNCICPGSVDTPMLRGEMEALGGVEKAMVAYKRKHPMGRIAQPEEIAKAALFLASDEASFITGVALPVDGGRMAGEVVVI